MSPSLTTAWRSSSSCTSEPKLRSNGVLRKRSYDSCHGELAHTSAASAATSMTIPPAASTWVKRSAGRTKARGTNRSESFHVGRTAGAAAVDRPRFAHGRPDAPVLGVRKEVPDPEPNMTLTRRQGPSWGPVPLPGRWYRRR